MDVDPHSLIQYFVGDSQSTFIFVVLTWLKLWALVTIVRNKTNAIPLPKREWRHIIMHRVRKILHDHIVQTCLLPVHCPHHWLEPSRWQCLVKARPPTESLAAGWCLFWKEASRLFLEGGTQQWLPTVFLIPMRSKTPLKPKIYCKYESGSWSYSKHEVILYIYSNITQGWS